MRIDPRLLAAATAGRSLLPFSHVDLDALSTGSAMSVASVLPVDPNLGHVYDHAFDSSGSDEEDFRPYDEEDAESDARSDDGYALHVQHAGDDADGDDAAERALASALEASSFSIAISSSGSGQAATDDLPSTGEMDGAAAEEEEGDAGDEPGDENALGLQPAEIMDDAAHSALQAAMSSRRRASTSVGWESRVSFVSTSSAALRQSLQREINRDRHQALRHEELWREFLRDPVCLAASLSPLERTVRDHNVLFSWLKMHPHFTWLVRSDPDGEELLRRAAEAMYIKWWPEVGADVFVPGDMCHEMLCVLKGSIKLKSPAAPWSLLEHIDRVLLATRHDTIRRVPRPPRYGHETQPEFLKLDVGSTLDAFRDRCRKCHAITGEPGTAVVVLDIAHYERFLGALHRHRYSALDRFLRLRLVAFREWTLRRLTGLRDALVPLHAPQGEEVYSPADARAAFVVVSGELATKRAVSKRRRGRKPKENNEPRIKYGPCAILPPGGRYEALVSTEIIVIHHGVSIDAAGGEQSDPVLEETARSETEEAVSSLAEYLFRHPQTQDPEPKPESPKQKQARSPPGRPAATKADSPRKAKVEQFRKLLHSGAALRGHDLDLLRTAHVHGRAGTLVRPQVAKPPPEESDDDEWDTPHARRWKPEVDPEKMQLQRLLPAVLDPSRGGLPITQSTRRSDDEPAGDHAASPNAPYSQPLQSVASAHGHRMFDPLERNRRDAERQRQIQTTTSRGTPRVHVRPSNALRHATVKVYGKKA